MSKQDGIGTWVWNAQPSLSTYDYNVTFSASDDEGVVWTWNEIRVSRLGIDYSSEDYGVLQAYYPDNNEWIVPREFTVISIDDPNALDYIQANATYQEPKLTDLTGTTWKWNNKINIDITVGTRTYVVDFYLTADEEPFDTLIENTRDVVLQYSQFGGVATAYNNGWVDSTYQEIHITGGTDATNQTLIDYLYANAVLQETPVVTKYPVNVALEHCTRIGGDTEVEQGASGYINVVCDTNYVLNSANVNITGATFKTLTPSADGQYRIDFENVTGDVLVSAVATLPTYSVTYNLTNCTKLSGADEVAHGADLYFQVKCDNLFGLSDSGVTVKGATFDRVALELDPSGQDVGQYGIYLTNVTGAVTVNVVAVQAQFTVTYRLTRCSGFAENPTLVNKTQQYKIQFTCEAGYRLLPENVTVVGATKHNVTVSGRTTTFTISSVTANVTITAVATSAMVGVTINTQNCAVIGARPTQAEIGYGFNFDVQCDNKYHLSTSNIGVTGASVDTVTDQTNGRYTVAIKDVVSAVTVNVNPVYVPTNIYTYTFKDVDGTNVLVLRNQEPLVGMTLTYVESNKLAVAVLRYNDGTTSNQSFKVSTKDGYDFKGLATSPTAQSATILLGDNEFIANSNVTFYPFYVKRSEPPVTTNLQLNVYQNKAEANRVDKTNYLLYIKTLNGTFREETDILNPTIIVEDDLPNYNYIYIPQLKRYYFVDGLTSIRYRLWQLDLSVDVLMTYKDGIRQLNAFVDRNENSSNNDIIDPKRVVEQGYDVETNVVENDLFSKSGIPYSYTVTGFALKDDSQTAQALAVDETKDGEENA